MPGSRTTPGSTDARDTAAAGVAFRVWNHVGAQDETFAAQWLAYAFPYRRFTCVLADADARLGANVDRYSFIAADLHRLLLAGLPAHSKFLCPARLPKWACENPPAGRSAANGGHFVDVKQQNLSVARIWKKRRS